MVSLGFTKGTVSYNHLFIRWQELQRDFGASPKLAGGILSHLIRKHRINLGIGAARLLNRMKGGQR